MSEQLFTAIEARLQAFEHQLAPLHTAAAELVEEALDTLADAAAKVLEGRFLIEECREGDNLILSPRYDLTAAEFQVLVRQHFHEAGILAARQRRLHALNRLFAGLA